MKPKKHIGKAALASSPKPNEVGIKRGNRQLRKMDAQMYHGDLVRSAFKA